MINQELFLGCLLNEGVDFFTGVPDTLLNDFCLHLLGHCSADRHVIAANEGNAVALACGYHFATGHTPLVYMQNSGLGNAVNPLLSLADRSVYGIPLLLLIGWRGEPSTKDHPHHRKQGEVTLPMLECMGIPFRILTDDPFGVRAAVEWAVQEAGQTSAPAALVVRKGVLAKPEKDAPSASDPTLCLKREDAIACVLDNIPSGAICIATTGRATRELHALRDIRGEGHFSDILNVGAMGHASSIAAGIALAKRDRLIVCFDGDAAVLMHMGSMAIIGSLGLPNVLHVLLNNGAHESVGGQPSAGFGVNLTGVAEKVGYRTVGRHVTTREDLAAAAVALQSGSSPGFIEVRIRQGLRPDLPPLKTEPATTKHEVMQALASDGLPLSTI